MSPLLPTSTPLLSVHSEPVVKIHQQAGVCAASEPSMLLHLYKRRRGKEKGVVGMR